MPDRDRRFLGYVIEETIAGRAERLKAFSIAIEVFGRDNTFDAQTDPRVKRWIDVCDMVLGMDVETVVARHGPISTKDDVRRMRDYLQYVTDQARPLYEAGMDYLAAAYKIDLGEYRDWNDAERIVVTVQTLFDDFDNAPERPVRAPIPYFTEMKSFRHHLGRGPVHEAYCKACGGTHG